MPKRHRSTEPTPATPPAYEDLRILRLIDEGTAAQTGAAFFRELVKRVAEALQSQYAFVSRFCDDYTRVHVIALWTGERLRENFDYPLMGSPCEHVLGGDIVAFNSGIQELFPSDREALREMGAESYLAIPLKNQQGEVLGHLAVIDTEPKNWQERDFGILRIFAARATAEIERQLADQEMLAANLRLARRVQLENLIATISTRFLSASVTQIDDEIHRALTEFARQKNSARGFVFPADKASPSATLMYAGGTDTALDLQLDAASLPSHALPEVFGRIHAGEVLHLKRGGEFERELDILRTHLANPHLSSVVVAPISCGTQVLGTIAFESVDPSTEWPLEDLQLLRLLGQMIASALMRRRIEADLHRAKEEAEFANRAKTEFLANMTHELRTPLNGILGYAQLLRRDPTLAPEHLQGVEAIESCGEHLLTLISEVLDLSKIEAGRLELELDSVDIESLVREIADLARVRATQSGLSFSYQTTGLLPPRIRADERKLRQVLLNLVGNAIKFTDHGTVCFRIATRPVTDRRVALRFEIEDTGIGIPGAQIERIFEPFHQVKDRERHIEGTGLGLAISRKLVEIMGGKLAVASEPGRGSTFSIELEAEITAPRNRLVRRGESGPKGYRGPRRRILIADDKPDNRLILGKLLGSLGFEVVEAGNGLQAVELTRQLRPDLIFMDLVMPLKDGFDAVRDIRALPDALASIPIVAVSASAFDHTRLQSTSAGCDDFITKPVRLEQVLETVSRLLGIDWTTGDGPSQRTVRIDPLSLAALPQAVASEFYELALQGDANTLQRRIFELEQGDQSLEPALAQLRPVVHDYDMRSLRAMLRPLVETISQ